MRTEVTVIAVRGDGRLDGGAAREHTETLLPEHRDRAGGESPTRSYTIRGKAPRIEPA